MGKNPSGAGQVNSPEGGVVVLEVVEETVEEVVDVEEIVVVLTVDRPLQEASAYGTQCFISGSNTSFAGHSC